MFRLLKLIKSIYYSFKYEGNRIHKLPIFCAPNSQLTKYKTGKLTIGKRLKIGSNYSRLCTGKSTVHIRNYAELCINGDVGLGFGVNLIVNDYAKISIGDNTYFAGDCKIYASKEITIGSDCAIAWGLTLIDTDFHHVLVDEKKRNNSEPIKIGNHVWIGANCSILKGVTIGDNSVVAAGSIVTSDIPPGSIAAGNPAKVFKSDISWEL
jgi:acetyltransferase-like isoleucine patch superfamily enzyme